MDAHRRASGAVIDKRLAPAGLTRLLGSYGARRVPVLAAVAALFALACGVLVFVPLPPATAGIVFVIPVGIISSELGMRAGLLSACLSIAAVLAWFEGGLAPHGASAAGPRSLALLFIAWVIGRTADRAARSRELLQQVLEATTDAIYVKDLQGRYLLVNSAAAELIGRPGDQIVGHGNDELLPEVAAAIASQDAAVLERRTPSTYELSGRFGECSYDLSVTKSPFCDASGAPIGSLGIARDITEQRRLQERFRRAFEDAPIGMAVADLEGRFLDVNPALCAITGYSREELCGRTFTSMTHPDDIEADYEVMRALISGAAGSSTDEKRYLRPDGTPVWVARSVTLVRDVDGTPLHFLDQIQDITDRLRSDSELRELADRDPLTGLLNHRSIERQLDCHVAEVARYGPRGALLVLDLDHFKQVNDAHGHHVGDELIVAVAGLLRERLRESDVIARLGGDEFAVLLPHAGAREADLVAADLVRLIRERASGEGGAARPSVTTSVGVATFASEETSGAEVLIRADMAMYRAKGAGRDGFASGPPPASLPTRSAA